MTTSSFTDTAVSIRQHTLARSTQWRTAERRQRRTDVLMVHPAEADSGVRFMCHSVLPAASVIPAHWDAVVDTRSGIVLGNSHGMTLRGVIPLLAALRVAGIDNAVVEVCGPRIPAALSDFDFYLDMLARAGLQAQDAARRLLCVVDTVEVRDSFGAVTLSPATGFRACVNMTTIETDGNSDMACTALVSDFTESSAGFSKLREESLVEADDARAARSLQEIRALPGPLRATLVEMIGYLALAGAPVAANIYGQRPGSRHYQALLHAIMERRAIRLTTVDAHRARHRTTAHAIADVVVTDQVAK